mmetsp:Transcript_12438/g.36126  ORF Transcript_12438/g.36126 Transcript_12438/m.36126 type:complete len:330 (+) Transcript_12438:465-1454(+)|eukprot:CAMPEP_0119560880 /NCGR_PEP_ID=MMETSP1352-20130426/16106_1 /TAXON_ID=265584 /ORGANISM="Stauroneis constricta, Strain CCMP1120" /LENGTH=329 /DNA_ID=CAMNT_0007608947 /DNA_START=377 /DNA_END=1366 /DNA_ORIENTATION=-
MASLANCLLRFCPCIDDDDDRNGDNGHTEATSQTASGDSVVVPNAPQALSLGRSGARYHELTPMSSLATGERGNLDERDDDEDDDDDNQGLGDSCEDMCGHSPLSTREPPCIFPKMNRQRVNAAAAVAGGDGSNENSEGENGASTAGNQRNTGRFKHMWEKFQQNVRERMELASAANGDEDTESSDTVAAAAATAASTPTPRPFWRRFRSSENPNPGKADDSQRVPFLKLAKSFNSSNYVPTIAESEVVVPGSKLQKAMAIAAAKAFDDNDEDECVICMEPFDPTNPRMPTLCGCGQNKTYFHLPCLYQWIDQNEECPSCRQPLRWEEF